MRVSTAGMNTQMIGQALRVQSSYAEALTQQSSGVKSESLSGLDGQAGAAVGLTADIARSEHLAAQAETATGQLEVAYATVGSIGDLVQDMLTKITAAISATGDGSTLQASAQNALDNIASLLNTKYAGSYLFSGGATTTQPVDTAADYSDTAYYQGGSGLRTVMLDGGASISYGINADDAAFADTLAALQTLAATSDPDTATLQSAFDTLSTSVSGLGTIQETLSNQTDALNAVIDSQTDFQLYAGEMLDSLTTVDVATASATASQREVLLEASFAALASLKSVSVLNYL